MARVALCQDVLVEYMGFMSISAVLKEAGHTVEVFFDDQMNEDKFLDELAAFKPDIVGFSVLSPSATWSVRIGQRIKERCDTVTVYGNVHVMTSPEMIAEDGVDIVCIGEGEEPMRILAERLDKGQPYFDIHSFWVKTPNGIIRNPKASDLVDLDELPFHDRDMYDKYSFFRHSSYIRILNGRGCPFACSFCTNPVLIDHFGANKYIRKQSPERAVREIEHHIASRKDKIKSVLFIDEVMWVKNDWLREFLELYKQRVGLPFAGNFRFGAGIKESDIKLLAEAGAHTMIVATESGDEDQRRKMMNKPVKNDHILEVAGWLHKYGVAFTSSCFFGMPGDTFEDHIERLDFFRKVNPAYLWTTFFQPYPGLKLTEQLTTEGMMPADKEFEVTLHHDMYLDLPDRERLVNLKKVYFLCMKFPFMVPFLTKLTKLRAPLLFDVLFMTHFAYYIFKFEKVSFVQFLHHLKNFAINPLLRKKQALPSTGRPYVPPTTAQSGCCDSGEQQTQSGVVQLGVPQSDHEDSQQMASTGV